MNHPSTKLDDNVTTSTNSNNSVCSFFRVIFSIVYSASPQNHAEDVILF